MNARRIALAMVAASLVLSGACSAPAPPPPKPAEQTASSPEATAARISGDWQYAMERGGQTIEGWLHFSLSAGVLVGSLTGSDNNPREISKIVLRGDKISWQIEGDYAKETYEGKLAGSSMEGTLRVSRKSRQGGSGGNEGSSGSTGGGYGGRRGGGRRGAGAGRGGSGDQVRWHAFRSVQPTPAPAPEPTKVG